MTGRTPAVVVRTGEMLLAVDSDWTTEMIRAPAAARIAGAPPHVRGVAERRGRTILLVDLRQRLGLPTLRQECEELSALLAAREEDHRHWLTELEACVREGRTFTLSLDPHNCAFGRWYDGYTAPNLVLEAHLRRFQEPHAAVHAVGSEALALVASGRTEEALRLVEVTRAGVWGRLLALFREAKALVLDTSREIAVLHDDGERVTGFTVDSVECVEWLAPDAIEEVPTIGLAGSGLVTGIGRLARDQRLVLLLNAEAAVAQADGALPG